MDDKWAKHFLGEARRTIDQALGRVGGEPASEKYVTIPLYPDRVEKRATRCVDGRQVEIAYVFQNLGGPDTEKLPEIRIYPGTAKKRTTKYYEDGGVRETQETVFEGLYVQPHFRASIHLITRSGFLKGLVAGDQVVVEDGILIGHCLGAIDSREAAYHVSSHLPPGVEVQIPVNAVVL